jgi:hypothetical protein
MFWSLFRKKPAPKLEPEKKDREPQPMRIDDFCKYREGFFTGNGHPANTVGFCQIPVSWPYFNGYTVIPDGMYPVIRVDGHCFHTFTRKLQKPFDPNMVKAMCQATKKLVEFFSACYGYTQSDEITIVLPKNSQDFGRKTHKLASLAAAIATAEFIKYMEFYMGKKLTKLPVFDGRAFALMNEEELGYYQCFRQHDASRNAISAVARAYYSHKQLESKNSDEKVQMLADKGVDFWKEYSTAEIFGYYFRRKLSTRKFTKAEIEKLPERHEARTNPDLMVVRSEILKFDFKVEYKINTSVEELTEQMLKLVTKDELAQKEVPSETSNPGDE